ncbi:hypothetical protein CsatB_027450 [Cannabis sativa]
MNTPTTYNMTVDLDLDSPNDFLLSNSLAQLNNNFLVFTLNFCHQLLPFGDITQRVRKRISTSRTSYFYDPFNFIRRILLELGVTDSTILFSFTNEIETGLINILNDPPFAASKIVFINIFIIATSIPEQEEESNIIDITFREALNAIPNVPATHESIKKLKELNEDDDDLLVSLSNDNNCTICQENLLFEDWKIVEMPCSHLFHKNCIVSWLKINHLCPLCRYSMPTSNNVAAAEN